MTFMAFISFLLHFNVPTSNITNKTPGAFTVNLKKKKAGLNLNLPLIAQSPVFTILLSTLNAPFSLTVNGKTNIV